MKHNHNCYCDHKSVKFCKHCNTIYCEGCNQEWTLKTNYYWYQPYLYGSGTTITYTNTGDNKLTTSAFTPTACEHGA